LAFVLPHTLDHWFDYFRRTSRIAIYGISRDKKLLLGKLRTSLNIAIVLGNDGFCSTNLIHPSQRRMQIRTHTSPRSLAVVLRLRLRLLFLLLRLSIPVRMPPMWVIKCSE
jgi:hypothetical protein